METVKISKGIVETLWEALGYAAKHLEEKQCAWKAAYKHGQHDPMFDVRADFYRELRDELSRALDHGAEYPGHICCNYEAGQKWHSPKKQTVKP